MKRTFLFLVLMSLSLVGCDDGTQPSSTIPTSELTMNTGVTLTQTELSIRVDVLKKFSGIDLRVESGDQLAAYISGNRYRFNEEFYTYPYAPTDKHYFYTLSLPVVEPGTEIRVALERSNDVSATNNIITVPSVPVITSPAANTKLYSTQDNYFTWMPGAGYVDTIWYLLEYCCTNDVNFLNDTATQLMIPAGTMNSVTTPREILLTVRREKVGTVDVNLKGGVIGATATDSLTLWLQN